MRFIAFLTSRATKPSSKPVRFRDGRHLLAVGPFDLHCRAVGPGDPTVPVHLAVGLLPAQAKAYRIADNQTAQLSGWDDDKLPLELQVSKW